MTPLLIRPDLPGWPTHPSLGMLDALAWGELGSTRARHALRHLRACPTCRKRLAWIRRLPTILEGATRIALREDESGILARRARGERVILPVRALRDPRTTDGRGGSGDAGARAGDDRGP